MSTQRTSFVCPTCLRECPTLRDWLSCHTRDLRAVTQVLEDSNLSMRDAWRGYVTPGVWRKALALLSTEEADDRAA